MLVVGEPRACAVCARQGPSPRGADASGKHARSAAQQALEAFRGRAQWQGLAAPESKEVSKLWPQAQLFTALGLTTVKPPPIRLSMKSICAPSRYWSEKGSTTTLTPACSTTSSSSAGSCSSDMPYEKPEHPPGVTYTRNAPSGACCASSTPRRRVTASSVKLNEEGMV